jgi:hypothetical protein
MTTCDQMIRSVAIPDETGIRHLFGRHDLADAFSAALPDDAAKDPETLARFMFGQQPPWAGVLMRLRDAIMAPFGVKTANALQTATGARVGFFRIYSTQSNEMVLGEDDRHLDFRVSVLVRPRVDAGGGHDVIVSTVVHCHNRLGRLYIVVIRPFHRMIAQAMLRRAARTGWPTTADIKLA